MDNTQYSSAPVPVEPGGQQQPLVPIGYIVAGVVLTLVMSVAFIVVLVWLANNYAETILVVRDIFIIALGLMSCVSGVVLILLLVATIRLVNMLEFELKPILLKTNETLGTIRGTTNFMSENVVRPMTVASSYVAGLRSGVRSLFGDPRRNIGQ